MPELVLMLLIFYGGQTVINKLAEAQGWDCIDIPPFLAGVLTIGFIFGAYLTETFRGAILAVPKGQAEAATAFGMPRLLVLRRIVLPQMVRHAIPGFSNNWLIMLKASTRAPFTFYRAVAGIYLLLASVSIFALSRLETRYGPGVRQVAF